MNTRSNLSPFDPQMAFCFYEDRDPPAKRRSRCDGEKERHLTEGAVIVAFGLHLLDHGATGVELHPDGQHGKQFDIRACLESYGFVLHQPKGSLQPGSR